MQRNKKHKLIILDHTGHSTLLYDVKDEKSVENTKALFEKYMRAGYMAYKKEGDDFSVVRDLELETEKIYISPQLRGG
jgi:hypothetical protein